MAAILGLVLLFVSYTSAQNVDGALGPWYDETPCTKSCDGGTKYQVRYCDSPAPQGDGLPCDPESLTFRLTNCNEQACVQECTIQKPCSCENVPKFLTGNEPNLNLNYFPTVNTNDLDTARQYLRIWEHENVEKRCEDARCNAGILAGAVNNVTAYVESLTQLGAFHEDVRVRMQHIIDCNDNEAIEGNLWHLYDYLCETGVAIKEIKEDLEQKRKLFADEKERCETHSWFTGMMQTFYKSF